MSNMQGSAWTKAQHGLRAGGAPWHFGHRQGCASSQLYQVVDLHTFRVTCAKQDNAMECI